MRFIRNKPVVTNPASSTCFISMLAELTELTSAFAITVMAFS